MAWSERYALKWRTDGGVWLQAHGHVGEPMYHHENPRTPGFAHCRPMFELDMDTLTETKPTRYCQLCAAIEKRETRVDEQGANNAER